MSILLLLLLLLLLLWSFLAVTISLVFNRTCTPHCRSLGARAGLTHAVNDVACSQRAHWLLGLFRRFLFRTVIRITEHTEYQFPKEQTLCYSQNKIADVTKINAMRPRKCRYAIFPLKDGRKLPKEHDYRYSVYSKKNAFPSNLLSGAELTECYSFQSGIRIGPKSTQLPPIPCILITE